MNVASGESPGETHTQPARDSSWSAANSVYFLDGVSAIEISLAVRRSPENAVPRQNLIRLAEEHRDPSIRPQAHDPEPGWRRATAILSPAALQGHTGLARRTGSGRQSWTCEARSVVVRTGGGGLRRPAGVA